MKAAWVALAGVALAGVGCDGGGLGDPDARPADAGLDAAAPDATLDAATLDTATLDAAPDAATPDAATPDAATPDAAAPDATTPDAGPPPRPEGTPRFALPIHADDRHLMLATPVFGVDHDPAEGEPAVCLNYAGLGFPHCYDGHEGSDLVLRGGFATMDRGSARVVAAAGGVVVAVEDGHYDRCHASAASADVSCDGHPMVANRVHIRHYGGFESRYLHLKSGSVAVAVGDPVACGTLLGLVGSSGRSSFPHLHFEVVRPGGERVDPYAGPESQPESWWVEQVGPGGLPGHACDPAWGPVPAPDDP